VTEIPDLSAIFGRPPEISAEQEAHARRIHEATHDAQLLAWKQVQFFAPILCSCVRRYDREDPRAPQLGCIVHGHLQTDHDGAVLMFGIPEHW
jgi:hypothetical protein